MSAFATGFVVGFFAGGWLLWQVSVQVERFRRTRYEFRAARSGLRTMVEMMWHQGVQATKGVLLAAGLILVVLVVWQQQVFG